MTMIINYNDLSLHAIIWIAFVLTMTKLLMLNQWLIVCSSVAALPIMFYIEKRNQLITEWKIVFDVSIKLIISIYCILITLEIC